MASDAWHFPRRDFAARVLALLTAGPAQALTLFGARRTGKTEFLLKDLAVAAEARGHRVIYASFWQASLSPAAVLLHALETALGKERGRGLRGLAPKVSFSVAGAKAEVNLAALDAAKKPPDDVLLHLDDLLERASRVNADYVAQATNGEVKGRTGSLTALPVIETQAGDVSAFVPTNVISITDGQIFLETDLFNAGFRPAINAGLSVSRVGGAAQTPLIKKLGGGVRLALAQYRELAAFSQFASDLDEQTRKQLERGERVMELMKQGQYRPLSIAEMALSLYAVNEGWLDEVPVEKVRAFEAALHSYARAEHAELVARMNEAGAYDEAATAGLKALLEGFAATQSY